MKKLITSFLILFCQFVSADPADELSEILKKSISFQGNFHQRVVDDDGFLIEEAEGKGTGAGKTRRRWVIYKGYADASRVPSDWHGWLHHTFDTPPSEPPLPRQQVDRRRVLAVHLGLVERELDLAQVDGARREGAALALLEVVTPVHDASRVHAVLDAKEMRCLVAEHLMNR